MNCDYPFQATLGRTHQIFDSSKRPPPDKAHWIAGVRGRIVHPAQLAMAWIVPIIKSILGPRQTHA